MLCTQFDLKETFLDFIHEAGDVWEETKLLVKRLNLTQSDFKECVKKL